MYQPYRLLKLVARVLALAAVWGLPLAARAQSHPHMLWSASDVAAIAAHQYQPFYADIWNEVKIDGWSTYTGPANSTTPDRTYEQAIISHGLIWLIDPTLAATPQYQSNVRFKSYFWTVLNLPGWSNCFSNDQISTGILLRGLTIGYDMHYDKFTPAERTTIVNKLTAIANYMMANQSAMLEIPPSLHDPASGYLQTFKVLRNKFILAFSGLGLVAYCLEGEVNENTRQGWLTELDNCLAAWSSVASPDGLSWESYSYLEFQNRSMFPMLEARTRRTGVNQFTLYPFIKNYPIFSIYSWIPGGDHSFALSLPYGDSGTAPAASVRTSASFLAFRLPEDSAHIVELANWEAYRQYQQTPDNSYLREDPLHYIMAAPSIPVTSPAAMNLPRFHYFPQGGAFVWRTGWDNMATYFSMTCAPQHGGHEQPESGNFVIYKGGNPYIAHHQYINVRNTDDYNVMLFGGLGQWGDNGAVGTTAEPASHWGSIDEVLADNDLFMVRANLKQAYKSTAIGVYHRDYFGFGDFYFVRDQATMTASTAVASHTHSYQVARQTELPGTFGVFNPNDIDSAMTLNPWSGSNGVYSLAPHASSLYSGSMQVRDLSATSWARSIPADIVNLPATASYSAGNHQRGYELLRTMSGTAMTSLMSYAFPPAGQSVAGTATANGEGFSISQAGQPIAYGAWSNDGGNASNANLSITGVMAGIHLQNDWIWGLDAKKLAYLGQNLMTSDNPVTFFVHRLGGTPATIQLRCAGSATMHLQVNKAVTGILLNGAPYAGGNWNWSANDLRLTLAASAGETFTLQFGSAAMLYNYP